jgi:hypothetical protein
MCEIALTQRGSIMEGYTTEEVIESCIDYIRDGTMIGVPVPKHEGKLIVA